ncbi:hypothetical protein ACFFWC_09090 [Plantactinospora siamensis]|uniref:Uncharacterized protein n=1 Tax=Plantactinospora siamensis TaxID=555372 RepID=A0ABV6P4I1_9ACTN
MTDDSAWREISERLDALGQRLKQHYAQAGDGDLHGATQTLRDRVQEAFDATGRAVEDEAVRADVREVGRMLADTLADTLGRMSDDVRETLGHRRRP